MKRALALETIHREVVGARTGRLAFSVSEPMPRGSGERIAYSLICGLCKFPLRPTHRKCCYGHLPRQRASRAQGRLGRTKTHQLDCVMREAGACYEKGLTTARMTMKIIRTAGISFRIR
jgi:hypothetical protein